MTVAVSQERSFSGHFAMTGTASPGGEGPTQAPPHLPLGWIAQWDSNSQKYYYVELSTGVSQWDAPTAAAPIVGTPASAVDHPYGVPGQAELITHPDGSQTVKHADGRMEPVMPDETGYARGFGGDVPSGDRGLGSVAMNALLGGKPISNGHSSSNNFGGLAGQVLSSLTHGNNSGSYSTTHGSSSSSGFGGKLVGQLASNLLSSGSSSKPSQNYHSGQSAQPPNSGSLAGSVMSSVAHMFGGQSHNANQGFGYSNSGQQGTYSGSAPPSSYQPSGPPQHKPQPGPQPSSYDHASASNSPSHSNPSYQTSTQFGANHYGHAPQQTPSFASPLSQYDVAGQIGYQGGLPPQFGHQHGKIADTPSIAPPPYQYGAGPQYGSPQPPHGAQFGHQAADPYAQHQFEGYGRYPAQNQHPPQPPAYHQGPPVPHDSHLGHGGNPKYY